MSQTPPKPAVTATPATPAAAQAPSPEAEANARINELQAKVAVAQQQVLTLEDDTTRELRLLWQKLQDRARQHGLAATGFADNAERFAGAER